MAEDKVDAISYETAVQLCQAHNIGLFGNMSLIATNYQLQQLIHNNSQTLVAINSGKGKFNPQNYPPFEEIYPDLWANISMQEPETKTDENAIEDFYHSLLMKTDDKDLSPKALANKTDLQS